MKKVDPNEKIDFDRENGLKIITKRIVDIETGSEFIEEALIEMATGQQIASSEGVAFRPEYRETILERHFRWQIEKAENERFWREEYPQKSFEERKGFWWSTLYRQMRWQGESGYDEYSIFTEAAYQDMKSKDPEIDGILDWLIESWPLGNEEELKHAVNKMRGRK